MGVIEIKILRWMGVIRLRIEPKNEKLQGKLDVASMEDKMRHTYLKWLVMYKEVNRCNNKEM